MKRIDFIVLTIALFILAMAVSAHAENYTYSDTKDFTVYMDDAPYLNGRMYASVDLSAYADENFKCISLIFADENGTYIHVQSNPVLASPSWFKRTDGSSPDELGYFPIENGIGNVYFRDDNLVGYAEFLYVVKCNSANSSLVWENLERPVYKELGKELPARGAWLSSQGTMLGAIVFIVILVIIMWLLAARLGRR